MIDLDLKKNFSDMVKAYSLAEQLAIKIIEAYVQKHSEEYRYYSRIQKIDVFFHPDEGLMDFKIILEHGGEYFDYRYGRLNLDLLFDDNWQEKI